MARHSLAVPHFRLRLLLIFVSLMVACVILGYLSYAMLNDARSVFLEDVLEADYKPVPACSIFFHETSSHRPPLFGFSKIFSLSGRQACAIESAALHNPNCGVFVMFTSATSRNKITTDPLMEALRSYANVHLRSLNLWTYARNTPIYVWLKNGKLFTSQYLVEHTSDFLRYLTLWRWGGTYLDLDVVVLRSMEELPPNYTGAESNTSLNAAIMNVAQNGFGHDVVSQCLQDFQRNFDGEIWGNNGPGVITRVLKSICDTEKIELMVDSKRCRGFRVFGSNAFYAVPYQKWRYFMEPEYMDETLSLLNESYVAHTWNAFTKEKRIKVGSNAAYGLLAAKHCPNVYAAAGKYF